MNVNDFQTMHMQTIVGQQPLPQSIFRKFLSWFQSENDSESAQKQDVTDETLETTDKTIVGAINEVKASAAAAAETANAALPASAISFDTDTLTIVVGGHTYALSATEVVASEETPQEEPGSDEPNPVTPN